MNNLKSSRWLRTAALLILTFFLSQAQAQVQTAKYVSMVPNTNGYYEYLPQGYNTNTSQNYPLIIFVHGVGELGDGSPGQLSRLLYTGLAASINVGELPVSLNVNGQNHSFIVLSPQFINWPSPQDINGIIDYAINHYRVNPNRIYLTGLSMGGGVVWDYVGNNATYANRVAAIVPICGASWPDYGRARTIANANVAVWAHHNQYDPTVPVGYTDDYISQINQSPAPNPIAKKSIYQNWSHDAWTFTYNSTNRDETGKTIYQWMLQFARGNSAPSNQPPVVNAGSDQTVQGTTANLSGTASDPDGSIASYSWSLVSGPSNVSFSNAGSASTSVSGMNNGGTYVFRLTVVDNLGSSRYDEVVVSKPLTAPGRVEAENYASMNGIQTENCSEGGRNIAWQDNNDWLDYAVNVTSGGNYTIGFRVASMFTGAQFQLRNSAGTVLATVTVPNTGSFQGWTTVNANVSLPAGQQTLRVVTTAANGGWNFNYMDFTQSAATANQAPTANAGGAQTITLPTASVTLSGSGTDADGSIASYQWSQVTGPANASFSNANAAQTTASNLVQGTYTFRLKVTDNGGLSATADVSITVNPSTSTGGGGTGTTTRIEAENYSSMSGIQLEGCSEGGQNVAWQDNNDWMDYSVNLASAGSYTVNFRVASMFTGATFQLRNSAGTVLATVTVPNSGSFQGWQTVSATINLPAGQQTLRVVTTAANGGWNFNWFEIVGGGSSTGGGTGGGGSTGTTSRIEAENYSSMSGVQKESTADAGGGQNVAWQDDNDWMDYPVSVASSGSFAVNFRVASMFTGAQFQLRRADGTVLTTVTVPNTGSFQSWQTVSANVTLPAGAQTLRVYTTRANGGWNFNWWELQGGTSTPPPAPTTSTQRIEAESFASQSGIQTEGCAEGGQNVGWQDNNDWMDYSVNLSSAATYTMNFRVASMFTGAQFQVRNSAGTVLATITVPNTGSFQSWQTVSAQVALPSGQQTLRIVTTAANGGWNFNWFEIATGGSTSAAATREVEVIGETGVSVYPNPVSDRFMLQVNNELTGNMTVQVVSMTGAVAKQFQVRKPAKGASQTYLSIGALPRGEYVLSVKLGDWTKTVKLIKQ